MSTQCQYSNCENEATTTGHVYGHEKGTDQKDELIRVHACDKHKKVPGFFEDEGQER